MPASRQRDWIHNLLRPEAFGHVTGDLQLMETHISWVVLTGEYAYKVKKPVDFGFLDFSSLSRREAACRDELHLNLRWSDTLYLEVNPITGSPDRPRVGGEGEPFEFAVRMRQFGQDQLLDQCLATQRIEPRHLEAFAFDLARFHQRVAGEPGGHLGTPQTIRRQVMDNFDVLLQGDLPAKDKELASRLQAFAARWFDDHRDRLAARREAGFVRECHGDLHLGNMLLHNDRVELFDCLEFSAELRWSDVMCEIAFLVMDLERRDRADLARHFLNAYVEHTGDHGGLAVLPFYMAYRAMVRAKVDQLRRRQTGEAGATGRRLLRELEEYIDEAAAYSRDVHPRLAILSGVSGTGKTYHSRRFIEAGFIRLRSDFERKRLAGFDLHVPVLGRRSQVRERIADDLYAADVTHRTYAEVARRAELCLRAGYSALIDATCLKREQRALFLALAERLGAPCRLFVLDHDTASLETRLRARQARHSDLSDADVEVLHRQQAACEALGVEERQIATVIDERTMDPDEILHAWLAETG